MSDEPQMLGVSVLDQNQKMFDQLMQEIAASLGITYDQMAADYDRTAYSASAEFIKIQIEWAEESLKRKYPYLRKDPRLDGLT